MLETYEDATEKEIREDVSSIISKLNKIDLQIKVKP